MTASAKQLRVRERWAPWWLGAIAGALYSPFVYAMASAYVDPLGKGQGIRVFLPLYLLIGYWALALIANRRVSLITPDGVSVTLRPFPIGSDARVGRSGIASVYALHTRSRKRRSRSENYFSMGIETRAGRQIDIRSPLATVDEALLAGREIAEVLNANRSHRFVDVQVAQPGDNTGAFRRIALVWIVLTLLAILLGAGWELKSGTL